MPCTHSYYYYFFLSTAQLTCFPPMHICIVVSRQLGACLVANHNHDKIQEYQASNVEWPYSHFLARWAPWCWSNDILSKFAQCAHQTKNAYPGPAEWATNNDNDSITPLITEWAIWLVCKVNKSNKNTTVRRALRCVLLEQQHKSTVWTSRDALTSVINSQKN